MSVKTDEKRLEFAEKVGKSLEQGFIPWQSAAVPSAAPENAVSGRPYKDLQSQYKNAHGLIQEGHSARAEIRQRYDFL